MMMHATLADDVHPEQPQRIACIFEMLQRNGCIDRMVRIPTREALRREIELVHDPPLWDSFESIVQLPVEELKAYSKDLEIKSSLYLNPHSTFCARLACGSAMEICSAVAASYVRNGIAIVRPPGHHAEPGSGTGFCLYNNVAVAAKALLERPPGSPDRVQRVMILDWDVHHGNGTQRAFWDDDRVLYVSLHRYENGTFYPGSTFGHYEQVGGAKALGTSVNVPWPSGGMNDADYLYAFQRCIMPIAYEFNPDLVIVSAGFDAAAGDLLGGCFVSPAGYAHMTHQLMSLARGKIVVVLEGGYTLDAIASSALAVTQTLLGEPLPPWPTGLACSTAGADTVARVVRAQAPYWTCMRHSLDYAPPPQKTSIATWAANELYLDARAARLWADCQMVPLPAVGESLARNQALITPSTMVPGTSTLLVFVHDMGTWHVGDPDDPQRPPLFLADAADTIVQWARTRGFACVDLCTTLPVPVRPLRNSEREKPPPRPDAPPHKAVLEAQALYVWDNVCALSPAQQIFFVGFGSGCDALMHIIANRVVQDRVKAVVQVMGLHPIPLVPKQRQELKSWYLEHSTVLCPHRHPLYEWNEQQASGKRLGRVQRADASDPSQVLLHATDVLNMWVNKSA
ncbi:histone deacetylase [Malassezia caprae]|uniref:histone deacetylase n=1 Tax=Malassezia caprae TaxID=1381934 RepID=A0AAF0IWA6_9BASI|nr:histone deacetylase [Malassezia caprae]